VAAREGHSPLLALLLDAGASIEARDEHGETALLRCVEGGHAGSVELLLSRGADARATSTRGLGTLHIAAALGHAHLFALLVAAGADVNAADGCEYEDADGRRTPLMYAAHYGCAAAFKQLLALGVDLRALSAAGWPALFYAVENSKPVVGRGGEANRHLEVIRIILERDRADCVWCTVQHGRTALMVAAMQDAAEAVRLLLEAQPWALAWRDARGRSAAHWAAVRGANDALEVLVAKGTDVRALDQDGKTPGDLLPPFDRTPVLRQWEAERRGAAGERRWDYNAVMEATTFRYMRKATAARRVREGAQERQCASCQRYSFDALRCGACRAAFYCGCECQRRDWTHGGHRLWCVPVPQSEGGQTLGAGREALEAMEKKPW
jgi:ankyrin repeat protein